MLASADEPDLTFTMLKAMHRGFVSGQPFASNFAAASGVRI